MSDFYLLGKEGREWPEGWRGLAGCFQRWEFIKENKNPTKKVIKKKRKFFLFFLVAFLVESVFSFFFFLTVMVFSFFLDRFFVESVFSFINCHLRVVAPHQGLIAANL